MPKAITWVISLLGVGYAIALTLLIVGCVEDDKYWGLFMLAPYLFTPTMTIFIRPDSEDGDFWLQFAFFIIALSTISSFAMPFVFWSNSAITGVGLGYLLGASISLYLFMGGAMYFAFADVD